MKIDVKFNFLDKRQYVHSTQLTYKLLEILKNEGYYNVYNEIDQITSAFKMLVNKHGFYVIDEDFSNQSTTSFIVQIGNKKIRACYVEGSELVSENVPYDELSIIDGYSLDMDNLIASIKMVREDNIYNVIIALGKQLILKYLPIKGYTQWYAGKYNIKWNELHNHSIGKTLSVKICNNINDMYVQSKIYIDDIFVGTLDNIRDKVGK